VVTDSAIRIRHEALEAIIAHARAEAPDECCGMLVGAGTAIDEAAPAKNVSASPTRFLIDPKDHFDTLRAARRDGVEVLGFYHSHPQSPAWPSPRDIAEAAYPDAVYLIVSLAGGAAEARVFRIAGGSVIELPFLSVT
jgi:proteasome lid subunit RPN8/RPN11